MLERIPVLQLAPKDPTPHVQMPTSWCDTDMDLLPHFSHQKLQQLHPLHSLRAISLHGQVIVLQEHYLTSCWHDLPRNRSSNCQPDCTWLWPHSPWKPVPGVDDGNMTAPTWQTWPDCPSHGLGPLDTSSLPTCLGPALLHQARSYKCRCMHWTRQHTLTLASRNSNTMQAHILVLPKSTLSITMAGLSCHGWINDWNKRLLSSPKHLPTTCTLYGQPHPATPHLLLSPDIGYTQAYITLHASPPSWLSLLSPNLMTTIATPTANHTPRCHVTPGRFTDWNMYHVTVDSAPLSPPMNTRQETWGYPLSCPSQPSLSVHQSIPIQGQMQVTPYLGIIPDFP